MELPLRRLWLCAASVVLALGLLALALSMVQGAGSLTRITTYEGPNPWNPSSFPIINADGTKIVFNSHGDFLGEGITNTHIWLYDTQTMTFTRISPLGGFGCEISADGKKVAFAGAGDIWLYDTIAQTATRITSKTGSDRYSFGPNLNGNGTKIAFASDSDFLSQGIPKGQYEIWLYDTAAMTVTRITTASSSDRFSGTSIRFLSLDLSTDGKRIAFASDSDFLGQGILNDQFEIWLYDTDAMTVTRITTSTLSNGDNHLPSLNSDGIKVAFTSDVDFLGQGISALQFENWLYNTPDKTLTRVTTATHGDRGSVHPSLNADGTKLAFMSDSDFFGQGISRGETEIWVYDTVAMTLTRVTTNAGSGIRGSEAPSINADGTVIAFASTSDFFGQGIQEMQKEIWLYESSPSPRFILSTTQFPTSATANRPLTYTLILTNNGSADATGVVVTDTLDSNVTFVSASHGGLHHSGVVTWNVGAMAKGQAITRTLSVTVGNVPDGTDLTQIISISSIEGASRNSTLITTVDRHVYLPILLKQISHSN